MKYILSIIILALVLNVNIKAEIDVSKKPEALAAKEFKFPSYTEKKLSNGLKVFIIEDNSQPTISMSLLVPGGTSVDGSKAGLANAVAAMLTKGAGKRSALDIATSMDGIGANLNANASGDFFTISASGLKKHLDIILGVWADVVINPTFSDDEFEKLVPQMISGIKDEKSKASSLAAALSRKVIYGENHPYALKATEQTVSDLKINDLKEFYNSYFKPNNATLAVIGDVKADEIVKKLEKALSKWQKGNTPKINIPAPAPMPLGVYFINRPASVQSSVVVTTSGLPYADENYDKLNMAAKVMGAGFGGRMFRTLREKYSFTYTPFGYLTSSKYTNRFACGADVNQTKTDSSVSVILEQLQLLANESPTDEELGRLKKYEIGQYYTSFENSAYVASLIQYSDFYGIPLEKAQEYPIRVQNITPDDVRGMAYEFMNPRSAYIVVVGNESVRESLAQFGKIFDYNMDIEAVSGEKGKFEKVSLDGEDLMEKHLKALGGKDAVNAINTLITKSEANMRLNGSDIKGEIVQTQKAPNKYTQLMDMKMFKQEIICDGNSAWVIANGMNQKLEGKEFDKIKMDGILFASAKLIENGFKVEVLGKQGENIVAKITSAAGEEAVYYFDAKSFLLNKVEQTEETAEGPAPVTMTYSDYKNINGVMLPGKIDTESSMFNMKTVNKYEVNVLVDDAVFVPAK